MAYSTLFSSKNASKAGPKFELLGTEGSYRDFRLGCHFSPAKFSTRYLYELRQIINAQNIQCQLIFATSPYL